MSVFQQGNTWLSAARQRAKQGIMQAMGGQSLTEDQEYDDKYRNFSSHVQELSKMKELMEIWLDSFDSFCKATCLLSDAWRQFHSSNPYTGNVEDADGSPDFLSKFPFYHASKQLDEISVCIDERIRPAIMSTFSTRCIKPVSSILSLVPGLQESHQTRKNLLSEFDSYRIKMEKEFAIGRDSSHPNVMRKAVKLDESAKRLHSVQSNLFQKFYEFEIARSQTLGPELGVFISCMYSFSSVLHSELSEIVPLVPQSASTLATLDALKLSPPAGSNKFIKSTQPVKSIQVSKQPIDFIVSRPISAGGAAGGYGIVTVQDYHLATQYWPSSDESQKYIAPSSSFNTGDFSKSGHESSIYSSIVSEPPFPPSRPVSELSTTSTYHSMPPPSTANERIHSERFPPEEDSDEDLSSRPISDITMGTFDSFRLSGVTSGGPDNAYRPPKPPRKPRPASSSMQVNHMEAVCETIDEDASTSSSHDFVRNIKGNKPPPPPSIHHDHSIVDDEISVVPSEAPTNFMEPSRSPSPDSSLPHST